MSRAFACEALYGTRSFLQSTNVHEPEWSPAPLLCARLYIATRLSAGCSQKLIFSLRSSSTLSLPLPWQILLPLAASEHSSQIPTGELEVLAGSVCALEMAGCGWEKATLGGDRPHQTRQRCSGAFESCWSRTHAICRVRRRYVRT